MESKRQYRYSFQKHPYYQVRCSRRKLRSGRRIKGWFIYDYPDGIFTGPDPTNMNESGWCQMLCCLMCCSPCFLLPCFLSINYYGYQIPDFEQENKIIISSTILASGPSIIPVAVPVTQPNNEDNLIYPYAREV